MTATPPPYREPAPSPLAASGPGGWAPPAAADLVEPVAVATRGPWVTRREVRAGAIVALALVVAGVLAGFVWLWWSPPRGIALALGPNTLLPDETEAFIAADGRYAALTGGLGLVAGIACWCWRSVRGPVLALALGIGSGAGAVLTALIGRWRGHGVTGAATQQIVTPPLELRATGLLALEALVALLVYGAAVAVSSRDDLGVADVAGVGTAAVDDDRGLRPGATGPDTPPGA